MSEQPQTDHDLLIRMDEKLNGINTAITGVKTEVTELDKRLTVQETHSNRQDGAISALKWALGVSISVIGLVFSVVTWWVSKG